MKNELRDTPDNVARRGFLGYAGTGAMLLGAGGLALGRHAAAAATSAQTGSANGKPAATNNAPVTNPLTVAADPAKLPPPIHRRHALHHDITLEVKEMVARLADGSEFSFMTWNRQVPGPMIRVRQGDTVTLTVRSLASNGSPHNIDIHAVFGTGGGAMDTLVVPGGSRTIFFKCIYPGAFIYHCAMPGMDEHISRGMFGMILVEPEEGLPRVDREFYFGQHELYTREPFASTGRLHFDYATLESADPHFVLFNGAVGAFTGDHAMKAKVGETIRIFMVCGGPNLASSFHPIGNVWKRCWPEGAVSNPPLRNIQTLTVPPGSCFVGEMDLPVPETIKLVDHALTRVVRKGLLAEIAVEGPANPALYRVIS